MDRAGRRDPCQLVNSHRKLDYAAHDRFHGLRNAMRERVQAARGLESSDLAGACTLYRDAIAAMHEYSAITLETGLVAQLIEEQLDETGRTGEPAVLDRLTLGLIKLGRLRHLGDTRRAAHFTHSKVMAWVFFDRSAKLAESEGELEQARRYRAVADEIHAEVCARAYDAGQGSFMQAYGSRHVDASLLQIALTGFLPADDPRMVGTVALIEARLTRDGLLLRYDSETTDDGLAPGEGTFLVCSFWLADVYVLLGRHADARRLFERLVALCNDVGLLSEQYDPLRGRMLGNFPQAFSHIGIINTALNLYRAQGPAQERVEVDGEPR